MSPWNLRAKKASTIFKEKTKLFVICSIFENKKNYIYPNLTRTIQYALGNRNFPRQNEKTEKKK